MADKICRALKFVSEANRLKNLKNKNQKTKMAETLEDKVNSEESKGFMKKALKLAWNVGIAAASSVFSYGLVGISGPLTGVAFAAGSAILNAMGKNPDKKSKGLNGLIKDFSVGSLTGIIGVWGYDLAAQYFPTPGIARALFGVSVVNPVFTASYMANDYIIKNNFNPTGIGKYFRDNYWPILKDVTLWLGLPVAITINGYGIPATLGGLDMRGYPTILVADSFYRIRTGLTQSKIGASNPYYSLAPHPA